MSVISDTKMLFQCQDSFFVASKGCLYQKLVTLLGVGDMSATFLAPASHG
jgi:hypothetical protein